MNAIRNYEEYILKTTLDTPIEIFKNLLESEEYSYTLFYRLLCLKDELLNIEEYSYLVVIRDWMDTHNCNSKINE